MLKTNSKKKNTVRRPNNSGPLGRPPPYLANSYVSRVFRFQYTFSVGANPSISFLITPTKLCALQAIVTTANTTATMLYDAVKVRKVCLFCPASSVGNVYDIAVSFEGATAGTFGSDKLQSAQTYGSTIGAEVSIRPDRLSQAAQWQPGDTTAGATGIFTLFVSGITSGNSENVTLTCDLHLTLRTTPSTRTSGNTVSISSSSPLGSFVNLPLDSNAGSNGATGRVWLPDRNVPTAS